MTPVSQGAIRVLLADDHPLVREGLRAYLASQGSIEVAGEAADGLEAVARAREARPDVVLLDLTLPGMNGLEAARQILTASPGVRVLVFTMQEDPAYLREARRGGVHGYLVKDAPPREVLRAIEAVHGGDPFYTWGTSQAIAEEDRRTREAPAPGQGPPLSRREREVLELLVQGLTSREIAERLRLGIRTVESHRGRLRRKLGIDSVAGLTRYAIEHRLLPAP